MVTVPSRNVAICLFVILLCFASVPLFGDKYFVKLALRAIIFSIFAMSLDLLIGYTGLVSFGHAAFFGLGAYIVHLVSPVDESLNLFICLSLTLGLTAVAASIIGAFSVRTKGVYFIMVTLAFAQMMFYFFFNWPGAGGSDGAFIFFKPALKFGDLTVIDLDDGHTLYFFSLFAWVACYILLIFVLRSPFGQVIQGIKINEHRMQGLGYDTYLYKLVSFVIAGTIAGFAGFLFACIDGFVSPGLLGWRESGIAMVMVILGGQGTLFGALLGSVGFHGMEEIFREPAITGVIAEHWQILMGIFVICVVLFLKNGLSALITRFDSKAGEDV
ncbi:MAG: hypothetical protein CFH06_00535 [Alphaproteobacteria bacterium MarineAlpha3_Bin5]|nr:branched-chain amino acid ABC transporter permease [Magnetovibrio sp.]PPR79054.1 MAG: hypothetical protein CFH06_00535 [Alphaproteobacteria bacterium MarineAlpha3_Bin5]